MSRRTLCLLLLIAAVFFGAAALATLIPYPTKMISDLGYFSMCPFAPYSKHPDAFDAGRIVPGGQAAHQDSASVNRVSLSDMIRSLVLIFAASLSMGAEPPSASSVMSSAQAEAASQHKTILLIFHASWCGWCHRFDQFREIPENKAILQKYFVEAQLDVQEHGDKKVLENPGGNETMKQVAGGEAGLPFFAFLNEKGGVIVTTIRPGDAQAEKGNIGYPNKPWEIDWFMAMLRKAAPAMTPDEAGLLEKSLRSRAT